MEKRKHGDPDRIMEHAESGYILSHSEEIHLCKYTRSLRAALAEKTALLESHGPEGHNVTNEQFVALRRELAEKTAQVERLREALEQMQTDICGYAIASEESAMRLVKRFYEIIQRHDELAREALSATAPDAAK